ncbi:MAG: sulfatase-like hydrolase/transferase [Bryobacteraceae bacterium]
MNRRSFLAGAAAPLLAQKKKSAAPATTERPNIVLVLADDLAAWMVGCYGNKEIKTPNIDNLARGGMRFVNNFVNTPICSASRATLFTGRTPRQHGIHDFLTPSPIDQPPQGQKEPPASFASETMISDVLSQAGYDCGYVGKWHMGGDTKPAHGYKYTYTFDGGSSRYQDPVMFRDGERREEKGYLTEITTRGAVEFLDSQQSGKPFFLTVSYFNPHTPYDGHPQRYYDMYANTNFESFGWESAAPNALREKNLLQDTVGNLRKCAASTTALDDQIPALLEKLDQKGLRGNTLVLFTGDNGFLLGRHGLWSKGLASDPINMYEEVMQVPMIWNWQGKTPVESTRPELVSFYDVMPTLCDLAGAPVPSRNLPGRSYLPLALGHSLAKGEKWRTTVFGEFRNTEMARDNRYKIVVRNGGRGPNELFDLAVDPREKTNQWDNAQFLTVRERLVRELTGWRGKTAS